MDPIDRLRNWNDDRPLVDTTAPEIPVFECCEVIEPTDSLKEFRPHEGSYHHEVRDCQGPAWNHNREIVLNTIYHSKGSRLANVPAASQHGLDIASVEFVVGIQEAQPLGTCRQRRLVSGLLEAVGSRNDHGTRENGLR